MGQPLVQEAVAATGVQPRRVAIRRGHVMEDAAAQLAGLGPAIKGPLSVLFYDEHGLQEAGALQNLACATCLIA
jgi:hypothetical protein